MTLLRKHKPKGLPILLLVGALNAQACAHSNFQLTTSVAPIGIQTLDITLTVSERNPTGICPETSWEIYRNSTLVGSSAHSSTCIPSTDWREKLRLLLGPGEYDVVIRLYNSSGHLIWTCTKSLKVL